MPACLDALGHDGIDASLLDQRSFLQIGRRGHGENARFAQGLDSRRRWQTEMETHHGRSQFKQHLQGRCILHEGGIDLVQRRRQVCTHLGEQRCQMLQPRRFAHCITLRRGVAKDINVEGLVGQGACVLNHLPRLSNRIGSDAE